MQARRNSGANQPALIPIAGHCDRKPRTLDRDVTTVGRARGSDFCLEANEISTLHCIIYRAPDGFRIRDCNSRWGTRINGEAVKTALLHDGDIINLGPFSFEIRVPSALFPADGARIDPVKVEHWKASRARWVQRALKLRKRLAGASPADAEKAQKAHLLREKIRIYDQRLHELEAAEEELNDERRQLANEIEKHRQHVQKVERDLALRHKQVDEEIHERWLEFQRRCQAEECKPRDESSPPVSGPSPSQIRLDDQYRQKSEQLQREQQEFIHMKQQWVNDQEKTMAQFEEQQHVLAQKKADLMRMMGELKRMQEDIRRQTKPDVLALHADIERLEKENAELRNQAHQSEDTPSNAALDEEVIRQMDDLRAEVSLLREELETKDKLLSDYSHQGTDSPTLRAENELLKKLLEEKNQFIEDVEKKESQRPKSESDLERYESELNDLRRQLEQDRNKLNKEVTSLRERNKELDEAIREMEMEMSKERAELARERMRLERLREEVKSDTERLQREQSVRDTMAPVQKLRDELNGKQPPPAKAEKPLNDRLRGIRSQLADSHPSGS